MDRIQLPGYPLLKQTSWPLDVVEGCAVKMALFVKNCVLKFYINGITVVKAGEPI